MQMACVVHDVHAVSVESGRLRLCVSTAAPLAALRLRRSHPGRAVARRGG